jgi:HlyD family secretion protein
LDQLFTLTSPIGWVALVVAGVMIVAAIAWGFFGSIPYQVYGMGVLRQRGGEIYPIIAPAAGTVVTVYVRVGDAIHAGDKIADIALPDQEAQREGAQRNVDKLRELYARQSAEALHEIGLRRKLTEEQVASQRQKIDASREHLKFLTDYRDLLSREMEQGLVTRQQLETVVQKVDAEEQAVRDANTSIYNVQAQQVDFENQQAKSLEQLSTQIISAENTLNSAEVTVNTRHAVTSPVDGVVAEIDTKLGSVIRPSDQLVMVQQSGGHLELVAYLPVQTAKTIEPDMTALISPTTVESSIYGSIKGHVVSVSGLSVTRSAALDTLGDANEVSAVFQSGPMIQAVVELEPDPSTIDGVAWTSSSGPDFRVAPGTMAAVAVKTRQVHPIDLAVPIYETWVGSR